MTGDQPDFTARLRAALPVGWFPVTGSTDAASSTPVLDGVLSGLANAWAWTYSNLQFVVAQTRIRTATGVWLDVIALDYYGISLIRRNAEGDAQFRSRILLNLFRARGTRAAMISVLTDLTGRAPRIFEPANAGDTGGYGFQGMTVGSGLGYGVAGAYGSLSLPFQSFITAYRPIGQGIANVGGYYGGSGRAEGGYGVGAIEYASLSQVQAAVTDADIYDAIARTTPVATTAWTAISS